MESLVLSKPAIHAAAWWQVVILGGVRSRYCRPVEGSCTARQTNGSSCPIATRRACVPTSVRILVERLGLHLAQELLVADALQHHAAHLGVALFQDLLALTVLG